MKLQDLPLIILFLGFFASCDDDGPIEPVEFRLYPPQDLHLQIMNSDSIQITWQDASVGETGFTIERKGTGAYDTIANLPANSESFVDVLSLYGEVNHYRVTTHADTQTSSPAEDSIAHVFLPTFWSMVPKGPYRFGLEGNIQEDINYDYEMMTHEVSNRQYMRYLEEALQLGEITANASFAYGFYEGDSYHEPGQVVIYELRDPDANIHWTGETFFIEPGYEDAAVSEVTWYGAHIFAKHYNLFLPSEQEWEKSARGMSAAPFPWGTNEYDCELANVQGCGADIIAVGTTNGASPYGVLDLSGNVWEWVASLGEVGYPDRVLKGGACRTPIHNTHVYVRTTIEAAHSSYFFGFRCVRK